MSVIAVTTHKLMVVLQQLRVLFKVLFKNSYSV